MLKKLRLGIGALVVAAVASLAAGHGVTLLVSHDQLQLEQSGVPAWDG